MKKIIDVGTDEVEITYELSSLDKLIEYLLELRKSVPGDARTNMYVGGYDSDEYNLYFTYRRDETDEEYEARLKKEYWEKKRIEDDELAIYKRVKAKIEGEMK